MELFYFSDKGNYRSENQDSILGLSVRVSGANYYVLAVCDGMGGGVSGKDASQTVCDTIEADLKNLECSHTDELSVIDCIQLKINRAVQKSCAEIFSRLTTEESVSGTTVSVLIISRKYHSFVHVGDSRIYGYSLARGLEQLTLDDTWTANEVRLGRLTEEQAFGHEKSHVLIKAVGVRKFVDLHCSGVSENGVYDAFIITSDGYSAYMTPEHLEQVMSGASSLSDVAHEMLDLGQKDNLSAILVKLK